MTSNNNNEFLSQVQNDRKQSILKDIEVYRKRCQVLDEDIAAVNSDLELASSALKAKRLKAQVNRLEDERQEILEKIEEYQHKLSQLS